MSTRRITLFGAPHLEKDGQPIRLERKRAMALLAYLAANPQPHTREKLAALLWEDHDSSRAFAYLRNTLWTINKALGHNWAEIETETVRFNPSADLEVDIQQFRALAGNQEIETLKAAVALYQGDFMAGFSLPDTSAFEEWQLFETENLRTQLMTALERLIALLIERGEYEQGIAYARHRVLLDPLDEAAQRQLMRLYAWNNQDTVAMRQYQELVQTLRTELHTDPDPKTQALYERIQSHQLERPYKSKAKSTIEVPAAAVIPPPVPKPATNLPAQTTQFVGRAAELREIARLLNSAECRLLTLVGPGGMGKTRLAIRAAQDAMFADGVYMVSLAPLASVDYLLTSLAEALPFFIMTTENTKTRLLAALRDKSVLLVLDNFEHLLSGADILTEILEAAPGVKILATSRERLNLQEEWLFEINGMEYPDTAAPFETLESFSAIALFLNSARRMRPDFVLMPDHASDVVEICHLVQGMPLGIELAASWVHMLAPREIVQEIRNSIDFLTTTIRNVPERHRSLRAVFEYSWQRLTPQEQACLSRLSIFRGGFRQAAAAAVAGATLPLLLALMNKSLIRRNLDSSYELHELLRQYASQKLTEAEQAEIAERHCDYYGEYLAQQEIRLKGHEQPQASEDMQREIDNIRLMWRYAVEHRKLAAMQKSFIALTMFHHMRSQIHQGLDILRCATETLDPNSPNPEERLLLGQLLGMQAWHSALAGHLSAVDDLTRRSIPLLEQFPDHPRTAHVWVSIGNSIAVPGTPKDPAEHLMKTGLAIAEKHNDRYTIAYANYSLGALVHAAIYYDEARVYFQKAMDIFRELRNPWGEATVLSWVAETNYTTGDYDTAFQQLQQAAPLYEKVGDRRMVAVVRSGLSWYNTLHRSREGQIEKEALIGPILQSMKTYEEIGDRLAVAWTYYELGGIELNHGVLDVARTHLNRALATFEEVGDWEGLCWGNIYMGSVELAAGDYTRAEQHVLKGMATIQNVEFPWGVAGGHYVLGDIELGRCNIEAAGRHFAEALRVAYQAKALVQIIRHISGVASWLVYMEEVPLAATAAAFAVQHPAGWNDTHKRARQIWKQVERLLSAEELENARAEAATMTLDTMVETLLAKCPLPNP